jgi:hypothetical protein
MNEIRVNKPIIKAKLISGDKDDILVYKKAVNYKDYQKEIEQSLKSQGFDDSWDRNEVLWSLISFTDRNNPNKKYWWADDEITYNINNKSIRENIFRLLEEETKFNEGDTVTTQKDGDGIIQLSKHPYYSIKLDTTGITKSYHFTELVASEPIESEFGKYELDEIKVNPVRPQIDKKELENLIHWFAKSTESWIDMYYIIYKYVDRKNTIEDILNDTSNNISNNILYNIFTDLTTKKQELQSTQLNESPSDKIIKLDGILSFNEDIYLTDILSDIRSLQGITIVRNEDIINEDFKSKLHIKIDPYPFGDQGEEKIKSFLIKKIKEIPGVRDFHKIKHIEKLSNNQKLRLPTASPIPVSSMDELEEIKVNNPSILTKLIPGNYYDIVRSIGKQAIKEYNKINIKRFYSLEEKNGEKQLWMLGCKYIGDEEFEGYIYKQFLDPWDGEEFGIGEDFINILLKDKWIRLSKKQPESMNESKIRLKLKK